LYYRHATHEEALKCPLRPWPWVPARRIEAAVLEDLFELFGNPAQIERALKAAVPDCDDALKRRERLRKEHDGVQRARERILGLIRKDLISEA
jgi:hypothetical protein